MRRLLALMAAIALVASLSVSSVAAGSRERASSFHGDFNLAEEWTGRVVGRISADLSMPTDRQLVPGHYDFDGARGNAILESHSQIGNALFWYDANNQPGGSNVAFGEGVECIYFGPNNTGCGPFAVMFVDNLDPAIPDQVAFANSKDANGWVFSYWYHVGKGSFKLVYAGT